MAKEICISTTPHETRLAIIEDDQLAEVYYERENEYTLAGSIYKGRVTRVLPGMQSSFVDVGLERDAFLYVTDFLEEQPDGEEYETSSAGGGGRRAERPAGDEPRKDEGKKDEGKKDEARRDGRRGEGRRRERPEARAAEAATVPAGEAAVATEPLEAEQDAGSTGDELTEGTRRWRGRRGRRRGGARAGGPAVAAETGTPADRTLSPEDDLPDTPAAPFALAEHGAPGGMLGASHETGHGSGHEPGHQSGQEPEPVSRRNTAQEKSGRGIDLYGSAAPAPTRGGSRQAPAITLPGEALAKYGQEAAPSAKEAEPDSKPALKAPVNYVPPKPATLMDVPEGWDGGAMLPGETISRHRGPSGPPSVEPATPVEAQHMPAPGESEAAEDQPTELPSVTAAEAEGAPAIDEYEPEEGASAAGPTPASTSELRISQLFGFGDPEEAKPAERPAEQPAEQSAAQPGDHAPAHAAPEPAARTSFDAGSEPAGMATVEQAPEPFLAEPLESRDTALPPSFAERFADEPFADDTREAPLPELGTREASHGDNFSQMVDQLQGFAPGTGFLEEETIDEDEYDFDPLHAHADEHDLEDLEEETLDGEGEREPVLLTGHSAVEQEDALEEADGDSGLPTFSLEELEEGEDEEPQAQEGEPQPGEPRRQPRAEGERGRRTGRLGRGGRRGAGGRQSAQTQDLPIISDLLKQGQEILVQIAKEPIAKKGARITSHIALPGRFLVFMPTVNHVGVSRKIDSDEERKRLKRILISEKGENSGGFIVRTAADGASEEELRADLRFLISLWTEIKTRADAAKAPALIYHDLNLVERILRDQVSSNFSTIWVDTEQEYERIVRFLNRFQPALVRRVKLYTKETPLFEHFGITEEISKALKSKVWLKSGGSIVINQTEALVAIDINTGKYVGKTARLEDTIVKTNLDAIPEIVRQIRLRDLGGIIVIDFIDMDERRNRHKVLAALEEAMKVDRAPSKVLQFNDFGLVAITRKRVKQSLERTLSVQCEVCTGTGMVKSPVTVCNEVYIELRKMQKHLDGKDVMLRVHPEVVKQLKSGNGRWINEYEEMLGKTIIIKSDPSLHPEQFDIH